MPSSSECLFLSAIVPPRVQHTYTSISFRDYGGIGFVQEQCMCENLSTTNQQPSNLRRLVDTNAQNGHVPHPTCFTASTSRQDLRLNLPQTILHDGTSSTQAQEESSKHISRRQRNVKRQGLWVCMDRSIGDWRVRESVGTNVEVS